MKPLLLTVAAVVGLLVLAGAPAVAQAQYLQVDGWVQWVAADRLQLVLDSGLSISVDLTKVPQREYQGLGIGPRDRVAVVGVISDDNRRLIATSVAKLGRNSFQAP